MHMSNYRRHCKAAVVAHLLSNGKALHYRLKQHKHYSLYSISLLLDVCC